MKSFISVFILLLFTTISFGQENCDNGIDDDGDGKIDLNDPDCACLNSTTTSLLNNHNFEQMNFCPNNWAQFNAATGWFAPTSGTSDYINSCGFVPASAIDAGIFPLPAANGNGVAGILVAQDYKEFIATCTNSTLVAGTRYQLNFDIASSTSGRIFGNGVDIGQVCNDGILNAGRLDITVYGMATCNTATPPNTNNSLGLWQPLGTATYLPSKNWNQLSIIFTPSINVNAIMLGSPDPLPSTYLKEYDYQSCFPYFYFDNIVLNSASNLGLKINSSGSFCENSLVLNAFVDSSIASTYSFQWYKNGIAIVDATNSSLNVNSNSNNIGNYQVKISNSTLCKISPFYNVNQLIELPEYTIDQAPCFPGVATITITTVADEYSFDNGLTWSTVATKGGLTGSNSPVKIMIKKNGCLSSSRYITINFAPIETTKTPPEVLVVQPGCQTNGSITVTTPALEYSFDNGVTWTLNPTLSDLPANINYNYLVKIKTLLGCITVPAFVTMMPFRLDDPTYTTTDIGCGSGGTITITTTAQEYSIDGGNSWSASPIFSGLMEHSYYIMIKNEFGCVSEMQNVYLGTTYIYKPQVSFTQPSCGVLGSITVLTQAAEYSFDQGITWSTNNIASNLSPGVYYIQIKDFQGCLSFYEYVSLNQFYLDINIDYEVINKNCLENGSIHILTNAEEYSINDGNTWSVNPLFTNLNAGYYFLKVRNGTNCESTLVYVQVDDMSQISPSYEIIDAGCGTYGSVTITTAADLYSFDGGVTWTTSNTITGLSGYNYFQIMVKSDACISSPADVNYYSDYIQAPTVFDYQVNLCDSDNNGAEIVNLAEYNTSLTDDNSSYTYHYFTSIIDAQNLNLSNQIQAFSSFEIAINQSSVFVAVVSPDNCFSVAKIDFSILPTPDLSGISSQIAICENGRIVVNAANDTYSYLWSNGSTEQSIIITEPGNYSVTATLNHGFTVCFTTKNFSAILSNAATITSIETQDWTDNNNVILINTNGFGSYEFSIDGVNYQASNVFSGLNSGVYTVYVRDLNGCGSTEEEIFLLTYPKFFTPNGDGNNDTWSIKFSYSEPKLKINIFDRHGKLLKILNSSELWDGRYNGKDLLSNDYWFVVTRENGKEYKGHFSLIR